MLQINFQSEILFNLVTRSIIFIFLGFIIYLSYKLIYRITKGTKAKINWQKVFFILGSIFMILFIINLIYDCFFNYGLNSWPFVRILKTNGIEILLPSIIMFLLSACFKYGSTLKNLRK